MFSNFIDSYKIQIILIMAAVLGAMVLFHVIEVSLLKSELTKAQVAVGRLTTANATLTAANKQAQEDIVIQNTAIKQLTDAYALVAQQAENAVEAVRKEKSKWEGRVSTLFNSPSFGDDCTATRNLLEGYRKLRVDEEKEWAP